MSDCLTRYQTLLQRLKKPGIPLDVQVDIQQQLALLLYRGFLRHTPLTKLQALPRYLKAIEARLDKIKPDTADTQGLQRLSKRYWAAVAAQSTTQPPQPERDSFRWSLEELRVSLFAQQLKTAYPVSVLRLEKIWNERG
jgi:ATP-dependent helicase HrpA